MVTGAHYHMLTDLSPPHLLTLMQWLSPGFPVGAFSYSHGLETLSAQGKLSTGDDLALWLDAVLRFGAGRNDAILLAEGWRGNSVNADSFARALAPSQERLLEATAQGEAFCETANAVWLLDLPPLTLPVAVGAAAHTAGLPLLATIQAYLHSFMAALTSAAQRVMPLGQVAAQRVLAGMAAGCLELAELASQQTLDDIGAAMFMTDIASMQHETQYSRMFRS
jgi:urease accessory protein